MAESITRYDCELDFDDSSEFSYASMCSYSTGDYVRYDEHVESHRFVEADQQKAFQAWYNAECPAENWSQQSRDMYWEVWKAAIKSMEVQCPV